MAEPPGWIESYVEGRRGAMEREKIPGPESSHFQRTAPTRSRAERSAQTVEDVWYDVVMSDGAERVWNTTQ